MRTIIYDPTCGKAVPDGEVEEVYTDEILENDTKVLLFSTSNIFNRIRLGIIRDEISNHDIQFQFQNKKLPLDIYGKPTIPWPEGFLDFSINLAQDILTESMNKHRNREENLIEADKRNLLLILHDMDIPKTRYKDYRWLSRNLGIANRDHPDYKEAREIILRLLRKTVWQNLG